MVLALALVGPDAASHVLLPGHLQIWRKGDKHDAGSGQVSCRVLVEARHQHPQPEHNMSRKLAPWRLREVDVVHQSFGLDAEA